MFLNIYIYIYIYIYIFGGQMRQDSHKNIKHLRFVIRSVYLLMKVIFCVDFVFEVVVNICLKFFITGKISSSN